MRNRGLVALAAGLAFLLLPGVAATEPDEVLVTYTYRGSGSLSGTAQGDCAAYGAILGADHSVVVAAQGVSLVHVTTWVNKTTFLYGWPQQTTPSTPADFGQTNRTYHLPDGEITIQPSSGEGALVFRPAGFPVGADPTMAARFQTDNSSWTSARDRVTAAPYPAPFESIPLREVLRMHDGAYPAGSRAWDVSGALHLEGAATIQVRDATIHWETGEFVLPPHATEERNETLPYGAARVVQYRLEEAFLSIDRFVADRPDGGATLVCGAVTADLQGAIEVTEASGTARMDDEELAFSERVLGISGSFRIVEELGSTLLEPAVNSQASGDIQVVGLDFQVAAARVPLGDVAISIGLGVLIVAALGAMFTKGAPGLAVLYTNLTDKDVRNHPQRKRILEVLDREGFMALKDLARVGGIHRSTVRYHTRVLAGAELVRTEQFARKTYVLALSATEADLARRTLSSDRRLRTAGEALATSAVRADAVRIAAARLRVTERAARNYISRYLDLSRMAEERGVPK